MMADSICSLSSYFEKLNISDISHSKNPTCNFELVRLYTYKEWPREHPIFPLRLAEAGFYFKGRGDLVQCYFCKKEKENWNRGDVPRKIHELLNPSCPFLLNPGNTDNVSVDLSLAKDLPDSFNRITSLLNYETGDGPCAIVPSRNNPRLQSQDSNTVTESSRARPKEEEISSTPVSGCSNAPIPSSGIMTNPNETPRQFRLALGSNNANSSLQSRLSGNSSGSGSQPPRIQPLRIEEDPGMLRFERNRLETFLDWPSSSPVLPQELAKSGFYFTGTGDRVQCVFCRGILRDWDPGDKPHIEHKNKFPRCPFLLGVNVGNVPHTPAQPNLQQYQPVIQRGDFVNQPQSNMEALGISTQRPRHPTYAIEATRLSSFRSWPPYKHQTPAQLAKAGFFYAGFGDNVKCFFCDGGLRNWEAGDEPWHEHARWFPKCNYVKSVKGMQFIQAIQDRHNPSAVRHQIETREIRARMELPMVRTVLEMGMNRDTVMKAIEIRLTETGDDFPSAQDLLNAVLNLEENPEALNVETPTPEPGQDEVSSPVAGPSNAPSSSNSAASGSLDIPPTGTTGGGALEEENRKLKEQKTCKVCMDEDVGIVFLPCGHLCCCVNCAPAISLCPICRTQIKGSVRTYIP